MSLHDTRDLLSRSSCARAVLFALVTLDAPVWRLPFQKKNVSVYPPRPAADHLCFGRGDRASDDGTTPSAREDEDPQPQSLVQRSQRGIDHGEQGRKSEPTQLPHRGRDLIFEGMC